MSLSTVWGLVDCGGIALVLCYVVFCAIQGCVVSLCYNYFAMDAGIHANGDRYTGEKHQVAAEGQREEWILTPGDSKLASCKRRVDC
jgi:hypothetical protein